MGISMIRGYVAPPMEGGAAYHGLNEQFGYTYITQEGEGWSEPNEHAFQPTEHWNGYDGPYEPPHPEISMRRPPGLPVPGPLGAYGCGGNCGCAGCGSKMGAYGAPSAGQLVPIAAAAAIGLYWLLKKPSRSFAGHSKRRKHGKKVRR